MMTRIVSNYDRWRQSRETQRVLESLDERTLKDVGLLRRSTVAVNGQVMLRTLGMR